MHIETDIERVRELAEGKQAGQLCDNDVHEPEAEHIFLRSSHIKGIKFCAGTTM